MIPYLSHRKTEINKRSAGRNQGVSLRTLVVEKLECRRLLATVSGTGLGDGVSLGDGLSWGDVNNFERPGVAAVAQAEVAFVPQARDEAGVSKLGDPQAGSPPSSFFHRIFVTGNTYPIGGGFSGTNARSFADYECTFAAFDAGWVNEWNGTTIIYTAFLSQSGQPVPNARDLISLQGPVYNTRYELAWWDHTRYLTTASVNPWVYTEWGDQSSAARLWSGSTTSGLLSNDCNSWTNPLVAGNHGSVASQAFGGVSSGCGGGGSFICIGPPEQGVATSVSDSFVYHQGSAFDSGDVSLALDTAKSLAKEEDTPQTLTYDNLINTSRGINGVVFDFQNLPGSLSSTDFEFQWSPQGAFPELDHLPQNWLLAPEPIEITTIAGSSDRVILKWLDNAIANRWLRITILSTANTGLPQPEVYYLGHLLGETTGPTDGVYTISFTDIAPIRTAVGQSAAVSSIVDIDKNGTVSFADISAMRPNIGTQLTNITISAAGGGGMAGTLPGDGALRPGENTDGWSRGVPPIDGSSSSRRHGSIAVPNGSYWTDQGSGSIRMGAQRLDTPSKSGSTTVARAGVCEHQGLGMKPQASNAALDSFFGRLGTWEELTQLVDTGPSRLSQAVDKELESIIEQLAQ